VLIPAASHFRTPRKILPLLSLTVLLAIYLQWYISNSNDLLYYQYFAYKPFELKDFAGISC
jgi:hypothetical protein